jgi:hypothetical protein
VAYSLQHAVVVVNMDSVVVVNKDFVVVVSKDFVVGRKDVSEDMSFFDRSAKVPVTSIVSNTE